ncbi:long-chain fatty acid--CoA ligase [Aestuariimicrobium sp. p3-SID1156]|uniref:AMP-dependent synthetase/ligase n=1 Tax=Aestuariimicrobium sp. p3-SID1156 TaxID=2916038 RepID=UPI00223A8C9F|nr:long-chain fatty acid--CoA ligase [Aestuariimicrobium sp. p3-SID1156]MCT1457958.1 long-chain fatty acid--CoA ligase [Aestuariimicrobium sp. p3-SID1156]
MAILRDAPLPQVFRHSAQEHPEALCWRVRRDEEWQTWTYAQADAEVQRLASALVADGIQPGDRVGIFANNRPEWTLADLAILSIGAIVVTVFATSDVDQAEHILRDSGATHCIVAGRGEAFVLAQAHLPMMRHILTMDRVPGYDSLVELMDRAPDASDEVARRSDALTLDDVATIIYTSGTTGAPRGAMLTHGGYAHQLRTIDDLWHLGPGESSLSFLPLAHALERVWTFYVMASGMANTYCEDPRTVAELMPLARPTTIISVPKLYEKVYAGAHEKASGSPLNRAIFDWALRVGGRNQRHHRKGSTPPWWWRAQLPLADKLVLRAIREAVGGRKTLLISGGAPLRIEVEEFFSAAGMLLGQGYGLTETGPMTTAFAKDSFKLGTVGKLVAEAEIRLGRDGEILLKGPHIMKGYWNNPEATAAMFDEEGWFRTGDVGYVDTQGYVVITDRLKDIIVTLGGKNVAPQPIEGLILSDPLFEYAVVLGDNRPYLTALLQPSIPALEELGQAMQLSWETVGELLKHPRILSEVTERLSRLQSRVPGHEKVRRVRLLQGLTMEDGTLTPTLKVKRKVVESRFAELIEQMYAGTPAR